MSNRTTSFKSIRFQIAAALIIALLLVASLLIITSRINTDQASRLYNKRVIEQQTVFTKVFKNSSELNETFVSDYSYWDEMVDFVNKPNVTFAEINILPGLGVFKSDNVWVYNTKHKLVYSTQSSEKTLAAPELGITNDEFNKLFSSNFKAHYFTKIDGKVNEVFGITVVPGKDTRHEGPAYGYIFVSRIMSQQVLDKVGDEVASSVKLIDLANTSKYSVNLDGKSGMISYKKDLKGIDNEIVGQLYVTYSSETIKFVGNVLRSSLLSGLIFYLVLTLILFILAMLKIVRPLDSLTKGLQTKDIVLMAKMSHLKNEFGQIAKALNYFFSQQSDLSKELDIRAKLEQDAQQRSQELEKLNNMMVGRELRMIELKKEVTNLREEKSSRLSAAEQDNPEGQGQ